MDDNACLDITKDGEVVGAVAVVVSLKSGKRDLIFMKKEGKTVSARSMVELVNILAKAGIPFEERKKAANFASERLLALMPKID